MKTICKTIIITIPLFFCTNGLQAQTTLTKLNQVELCKQWIGFWKAETNKDTTSVIECKPFYNGYEFYLNVETKGKIVWEQKTIMGYDEKIDKFIESAINNSSPDIILMTLWFTSTNKCEEILLKDISNIENASLKWKYEFKSTNLLVITYIENSKISWIYTYQREK